MTRVQRQAYWLLFVLIALVSVPAAADVSYFPCPHVGYFSEPCAAPFAPVPATPAYEAPGEAPAPLGADEPLFTPETVSPDTPPLFYQLLLAPTEPNARAYFLWHLKRMVRTRQVRDLLQNIPVDPEIQYWLEQLRTPRARTQPAPAEAPKSPTRTLPVPRLQALPAPARQTELTPSEAVSKLREALSQYQAGTEKEP